jgi:iron only hydrogenase large subunit-like protein
MTHKGISDIDAVMTTRELARLIKLYGIDMHAIEPSQADEPFHKSSSPARLTAALGGTSESLVRTLYYKLTGRDMKNPRISKMRGTKNNRLLSQKVGERKVEFAAVSPLREVRDLMEDLRQGKGAYDYIEVMACPGGCINGGGQPFYENQKTLRSRMKAVQNHDDQLNTRFIHQAAEIERFYRDYIGEPNGDKAKKLLHTRFSKRDVLL